MKNLQTYEEFLNEGENVVRDLYTPHDPSYQGRRVLFKSGEWMTPRQFLQAIKGSNLEREANNKKDDGAYDVVNAVRFLSKNLNFPIRVKCFQTGGVFVSEDGSDIACWIEPVGDWGSEYLTRDRPFRFDVGFRRGGNSVLQSPSFHVGDPFLGLPNPKLRSKKYEYNMEYGDFRLEGTLNRFMEMLEIYKEYYGREFNLNDVKKFLDKKNKIRSNWEPMMNKIKPLMDKIYSAIQYLDIHVEDPHINWLYNELRWKVREARMYRKEDEYGTEPKNNPKYREYRENLDKVWDILEKFANKNNLKFSVAAAWSDEER